MRWRPADTSSDSSLTFCSIKAAGSCSSYVRSSGWLTTANGLPDTAKQCTVTFSRCDMTSVSSRSQCAAVCLVDATIGEREHLWPGSDGRGAATSRADSARRSACSRLRRTASILNPLHAPAVRGRPAPPADGKLQHRFCAAGQARARANAVCASR